ncbi:hypothetical protein HOP51_14670 [Halomonas sp. MCCC 1A11036]|uniref:Uncharacterized protein n=1 Tax=Billgrantia zhangzhouensis TaxID=2733481 RepID=A0ABS9AHU8_9GAMM|nr:inositol oxygenase [Halomonas zhangzhouensis]MCE8021342.1 hypothetical protein [Halomonas zhangzhouensis]
MKKASNKQARVEPIYEASDLNQAVIGWNVVDESDPDNEVVVSEHETQREAIQAAEAFEQREN